MFKKKKIKGNTLLIIHLKFGKKITDLYDIYLFGFYFYNLSYFPRSLKS